LRAFPPAPPGLPLIPPLLRPVAFVVLPLVLAALAGPALAGEAQDGPPQCNLPDIDETMAFTGAAPEQVVTFGFRNIGQAECSLPPVGDVGLNADALTGSGFPRLCYACADRAEGLPPDSMPAIVLGVGRAATLTFDFQPP